MLGRLWFYLNDLIRALVNLNRAIRLPNSQPAFYLSRSLVHMRRKDVRRAWKTAKRCFASSPIEPRAVSCVRRPSSPASDYAAAMAALEQAFRLDPANPFSRGSGHRSVLPARAEPAGLDGGDTKLRQEADRLAARASDRGGMRGQRRGLVCQAGIRQGDQGL